MVATSPLQALLAQIMASSNQAGQTTAQPPMTADPASNMAAETQSQSSSSNNTTQTLANISAAQIAAQVANWAAQLEFTKERFRLLELPQFQFQSSLAVDQLAFQKATTAWQEAFQEASMTGTYQGKPTTQWLTEQAQLTGVLNGNQTLQGKLTDAQIAQMNASMKLAQDNHDLDVQKFGFQQTQWNAEFGLSQAAQQMQFMGYDPKTGQSTLQRQAQEATITGYDQYGRPTLARQGQEASEAQQYLNLLAGLRGPQNAFAQSRVIGNTPNSIRDIAAAWAGKYQIGGTTGSGANPTPASVAGLFGGASGMPGAAGGLDRDSIIAAAPVPQAPPTVAAIPPPNLGPGSFVYPPYTPPAAPAPAAPAAPTGAAAFYAIPAGNDPVPGRGLDPSQWNAATQAAVAAWNAAHPGFTANGTQLGYGYTGPIPAGNTPLDFSQTIPGRGLPPGQWNAATQAAVAAWNAAHPGYVANGSPAGYAIATATNPAAPGATTPAPPGVVAPTPGVAPGTSNETGVTSNESGVPPATAAPPGSVSGGGNAGTGGHPDTAGYSPAATAAAAAGTPAYQAAAAAPQSYAPASYQTAPAPYAGYGTVSGSAWNPNASGVGESAAGTPVYSPPGVAAPPGMWNYTPTSSGQVQVHPPGAYADPNSPQFSTTTPASPDDQSSWMASILPNQINAENYGNMNTYNQALGWAGFEDNGWDIGAAQDQFRKSLPRYGGPVTGSFGR